jgi:sugar phosphate isomerase/epimerase
VAKFAICNEFCEGWEMPRVFDLAARTGFSGVEVAPFTIAADVRDIPPGQRKEIRRAADQAGVEIIGLHWLLVSPEGLYITHSDASIRAETVAYFRALVQLCGDLGGTKMVIGSPKQRNVLPELTYDQAFDYAREVFESVLPDAEARGVDLCIEPLARTETDFITTAAEGVALCQAVDHPRFKVHLDVKAMSDEGRPYNEIIEATGAHVGHFHANDANRGYPGSGDTDFRPVVEGLRAIGYAGWVSVEVFDFSPGPEAIAAKSMDYLSRVFEEE